MNEPTNWQKNQEALEVLKRLENFKKVRLNKSLFGRNFGRANAIKPNELERVFSKRNIKPFQREYIIEDSKKYEDAPWEDTGNREGYDKGLIIFKRPAPKSFSFIWIPYFTQAHVLIKPYEKLEYKTERDPNQQIVETIDEKEALKLISGGYSLLEKRNVVVRECHFPDDVGPMDWPDPVNIEKTLFTLANPNTSKSEIDTHRIKAKDRHYSYSV